MNLLLAIILVYLIIGTIIVMPLAFIGEKNLRLVLFYLLLWPMVVYLFIVEVW